jgi:hypothetical protein
MKIQVICQECGKKLTEVNKDQVSNEDLALYEKTVGCEDHGGNSYVYAYEDVEILNQDGSSQDPPVFEAQQGALISSTIIVKAFKVAE